MSDSPIKTEITKVTEKLDKMDLKQIDQILNDLETLRKNVEKARKQAEEKHRKAALAHVTSVAEEFGFSLSELTQSGPGKTKSKKAAVPKYRNPDDPTQTWAGVGRIPAWLKAFEEQGKSREQFLIE